jgi:flagellar biosynthesis protein
MSNLPAPTESKAQAHAMQQAIALAYDESDYAPKVVAKGRGLMAEQIIAKAKENNVYVHESKELVALLMQVDLDDHIPPALYQAIAEILAWLYSLDQGQSQAQPQAKPADLGVLRPI